MPFRSVFTAVVLGTALVVGAMLVNARRRYVEVGFSALAALLLVPVITGRGGRSWPAVEGGASWATARAAPPASRSR